MKLLKMLGLISTFKKIQKEDMKYTRIDKDHILLEIGDTKVMLISFDKNESAELQKLSENFDRISKELVEA